MMAHVVLVYGTVQVDVGAPCWSCLGKAIDAEATIGQSESCEGHGYGVIDDSLDGQACCRHVAEK